MDKEELKELARDPKYISGIYNYCDRWRDIEREFPEARTFVRPGLNEG